MKDLINSVSLRMHSECGKMGTRITPNTDTFYAVFVEPYYEELLVKLVNMIAA